MSDALCDITTLTGADALDPVVEAYDGPAFDPKGSNWPPSTANIYELAERTSRLITKFREGRAEREARYYALAERLAFR
jgi:hypothetical protein